MIKEKRSTEQISALEIYTDGSCKSLAKIRFGGWSFIALRGGESNTGLRAANKIPQISEWNYQQFAMLQNTRAKTGIQMNELLYIAILPMLSIVIYKNGIALGREMVGLMLKVRMSQTKIYGFKSSHTLKTFGIVLKKVKGHDVNYWNNECDRLAQAAAQELKDNFRGLEDE